MEETNEVVETTAGDTQEETTESQEIKNPEKVLEALKNANAEAKRFREERDALQERVNSLENDEGIATWKSKTINAYARAALREQGVKDVNRVLKYLSLDGVDLDDKDNLVGFNEKVDTLKKDLPELFDVKRRVGGAGDIFANGTVNEKRDGTQRQVDLIFGGK